MGFQIGSVPKNVGVRVDQAGEHCGVTQVHHFGAGGHFHALGRANLGDAVSMDQHNLIAHQLCGLCVKKAAGTDYDPVVGGRRLSVGEGVRKKQEQ